jgi:hypothetical protein
MTAILREMPRPTMDAILLDVLGKEGFRKTSGVPLMFLRQLYAEELSYDFRFQLLKDRLSLLYQVYDRTTESPRVSCNQIEAWIKSEAVATSKMQEIYRKIDYFEFFEEGKAYHELHVSQKQIYQDFRNNVYRQGHPAYTEGNSQWTEFTQLTKDLASSVFLAEFVDFQETDMKPYIITLSDWNILSISSRRLAAWFPYQEMKQG